MQRLEIAVSTQGGCRIVEVAGEVDLATCRQLAAALDRGREPGVPLIADLSDVTFFDASGLHALLAAHDRSAKYGAPLRVVPSGAVGLVIHVARAHYTLAVFPDRRRALEGGAAMTGPGAAV